MVKVDVVLSATFLASLDDESSSVINVDIASSE
jgi:hypothetical protein